MKHYTAEDVHEHFNKPRDYWVPVENWITVTKQEVADLINAAVEAEREACAKECDKEFLKHDAKERYFEEYGEFRIAQVHAAMACSLEKCAKAIRARGAKE